VGAGHGAAPALFHSDVIRQRPPQEQVVPAPHVERRDRHLLVKLAMSDAPRCPPVLKSELLLTSSLNERLLFRLIFALTLTEY
jgi:hypothetical protein